MPTYYHIENTIVFDTVDEDRTRLNESIMGQTPAAKNSEAHEIFTQDLLNLMAEHGGGDEDLIYDEVVRRGGYLYAELEYDYEGYFVHMKFKSYWKTKEDYDGYNEWLMTKNILANNRIEDSEEDPLDLYTDPDNSPGRGYTVRAISTVDFNKPYRD